MLVTDQHKRGLASDGAIVLRGLFSSDQLKVMRGAFDFGIANPSALHGYSFKGTEQETFNDYGNYENRGKHLETIKELGLAETVAALWDAQQVWFYGEEIFIKKGGLGGRSPWHQDTSYFPFDGPQILNIWTSFEAIPYANSLEFVRGSHRGVLYNGTSYNDASDHTAPLWHKTDWPRLPNIEAERVAQPDKWDIFTFDLEPGDALVFHSGILHGGAPVTSHCPERHTLVYRFFGEQAYYRPLPLEGGSNYGYDISDLNDPSLVPGEQYRTRYADQLI